MNKNDVDTFIKYTAKAIDYKDNIEIYGGDDWYEEASFLVDFQHFDDFVLTPNDQQKYWLLQSELRDYNNELEQIQNRLENKQEILKQKTTEFLTNFIKYARNSVIKHKAINPVEELDCYEFTNGTRIEIDPKLIYTTDTTIFHHLAFKWCEEHCKNYYCAEEQFFTFEDEHEAKELEKFLDSFSYELVLDETMDLNKVYCWCKEKFNFLTFYNNGFNRVFYFNNHSNAATFKMFWM